MSDLSRRIADLDPEKRALLEQRLAQQGESFHAFPLSFAQERLWFLDRLEPGAALYTIPTMVALHGALDVAALHGALQQLVQRHESLRTTFPAIEGRPVQHVAAHLELPLTRIDLRGYPAAERQTLAGQLALLDVQRPFDLAAGPLVRTTLLQLADDDYRLILILHHILADGWSMGILIRELGACYQAAVQHRPPALPAIALQYPDYAVWQRKRLQGALLERQLAFWREQLAGAPLTLELPA